MKTFKFLMPFLLIAFALVGCNTDDLRNDIDELKNRVESMEAQVSALNDNMNALRVLVDGNKTIQSYTYDETTGKYTVTLSDGSEIVLTQGTKGEATTPSITISEDGYWVINGEKQSIKAEGSDAATPKFRINSEGYWQVDPDGDGPKDFENVLGEDDNPVKATTDQSISMSDEFFESVKEENGCLVVTLKDDGKTYSLPIVENLICEIVDPEQGFKDGVLTVGYGQLVELTVKVKGDNYAVTAPAGWTAVLGEPDAETNEAKLSLVAPAASALSRATADNTRDLTLQVNSGVNWAIDKIQVVAEEVIESYYNEFNAGHDVVIGEIANENIAGEKTIRINKAMYENVVKVEENNYTIAEDGIYFISSNVTGLSLEPTNIQNIALISDKPEVKVDCAVNSYLKIAGTGNGFIAKNINFKETEKLSYFAQATEDNVHLANFVLDNCNLTIQAGKNFMNVSTSSSLTITNVRIDNLLFVNNSINIASAGWSATRIFNYNNAPMIISDLLVANNVFYSYTENVDAAVNGCIVYANNQNVDAKIRILNNTFINVIFNSQPAIIGKLLNDVDFTRNIIFINTQGSGTAGSCNIMNVQNDTNQASYSITDNLYYRSVATFALTHYHNNSKYTDDIKENSMESNPFDGGEFYLSTGTFVPNSTYSGYGATIE